jgi:acyl carrier protein
MNTVEALEWIAELFEEPVENITTETPRDGIPGWDSLGILTLMARLDEDFEILLEEEEVQELRAVNDIIAILQKHGKVE